MDAADLKKTLFAAAIFVTGILFGLIFIDQSQTGILILVVIGLWWGALRSGKTSEGAGHGGH